MWSKMVGGYFNNISFIGLSSEEEASSAGEQLASNRIDGYTVKKVEAIVSAFLYIYRYPLMADKNSKPKAFHMQKP